MFPYSQPAKFHTCVRWGRCGNYGDVGRTVARGGVAVVSVCVGRGVGLDSVLGPLLSWMTCAGSFCSQFTYDLRKWLIRGLRQGKGSPEQGCRMFTDYRMSSAILSLWGDKAWGWAICCHE